MAYLIVSLGMNEIACSALQALDPTSWLDA
jgi:hypothetical protein